ncbi:MAG TPA: glycerol-3-phosphate 1-O-acyltransferase [Thiothrix sp.]|nr:glycerol-3-phosphate 1-O-acyltransferase [Thiothrix sp.]
MPIDTLTFIFIISAYLIGSLSSAIITCKVMGLDDPRSIGSKNPGATNVLRLGNKKAAIITLVGDVLKGLLPVLLSKLVGLNNSIVMLVGIAAFLGHIYPLYYQFKGGKGVATAIGVYTAINSIAALSIVFIWLFCAKLLKISSSAALISTLFAPAIFYFLMQDRTITFGMLFITLLIFWKHKTNIQQLLAGTEGKIGEK